MNHSKPTAHHLERESPLEPGFRSRAKGMHGLRFSPVLLMLFLVAVAEGGVLLGLPTSAQEPSFSSEDTPPKTRRSAQDSRSARLIEVLRLRCNNTLGLREVTLFGNGTVRLKDGLVEDIKMWLHELRPDEREAYVARLQEEDWSETASSFHSVDGDWVENCTLSLDLPGQLPRVHEFGRYDSLDLTLQRTVAIARELIDVVDQTRRPEGESEIPRGYKPGVGDLLTNSSGHRYRLVAFTSDGEGVELQGLDQPLTMYLSLAQVREEFVSVRPRGQR